MFNIKTTTNLDTILKGFNKTVDDLNTFINNKCESTRDLKEKVTSLEEEIKHNKDEIAKANNILSNINSLLGK